MNGPLDLSRKLNTDFGATHGAPISPDRKLSPAFRTANVGIFLAHRLFLVVHVLRSCHVFLLL